MRDARSVGTRSRPTLSRLALNSNDALDLQALWPSTRFTTADQAVDAFYAAYPNEEPDPYLADWIRTVIAG